MDHFKFDVFYHFGAYVSYMVEKALATLNAIFFGKKQKYLSTYCAQKKLVLKDWKKVLQCLCFGKYLITSLKFLYCVSSFGQFLSFSYNNGFFTTNLCETSSNKYPLPGFKLTTCQSCVSFHNP